MGRKEDREDFVIEAFCRFLSLIEGSSVRVLRKPDREEGGGCDAIIDISGRKRAVEHTRLDAFQGQRADDAVFNTVVAPLETTDVITRVFPDSYIEIVVPIRAVPNRASRSEVRTRLADGCIAEISRMPQDGKLRFFQIQGLPFSVGISRLRLGSNPKCIVMRSVPEDLEHELEEILVNSLAEKDLQLVSYARDGYEPILVIDNDDVMLLNRMSVGDAYGRAVTRESPTNIRDIFVADTGHGETWFYPLRLAGKDYPDLIEFEQYVQLQVEDRVRRREGDKG